jgi:hypothetical protein
MTPTSEEIAEEWKRREEARMNAKSPETIKVEIDNTQMQNLIEQNGELSKKLQQAEDGSRMFETVRSRLSEKYAQQGLEMPTVENLDQLNTATENLKKMTESREPKHIPAGTVPLSSQTPAKESGKFGSIKEMVDVANQDKDIRNALLSKTLKGVVEGKLSLPSYQEPEVETTTSDLSPDLKLSKKPDPMGIEHNFRKKKLLERAKKGDQQAIDILNSGDF